MRQDPYSIQTPAPGSYAPASYSPPVYQQQQQQQHQHQSSPPPAFVRQAAPTPYGYTANPQMQPHYAQRNDLSAPPPPHSLAPMAMSADATNRQFAITGSSGAQNHTMSGREKPSIKWGIMIALSGALLGGVLGLGMDARRQSARAAAAAEANDAAPPAVVAAAQPVLPVVLAPPVAPSTVATVAQPAVAQPAVAQPQIIAPPAAVVLAVAPSVVVPKGAIHTKPIVKPHGFLAAKVTSPARPAPEPKADAPEPKTAKADKVDPPKTVKKDANTSDAMKILEAANKDTTNTL